MAARDPISRLELLPLSPDRAIALLSHAAETGNVDAAYMLAMIYENGAGVQRDLAASARWLHRAAELDYDRTVEQLSRRCDDLLQHLLSHFDAIMQARARKGRRSGADEMRRALEALADSTHDLELVAALGRADEQRDTA
jgi:TPR repeat protein